MPDRRAGLRFEIVGRLRGSLVAEPSLQLLDVSRGGALVEAAWPLPPGSVHTVRLESDHHVSTVDARVCHVRETWNGERFLMGLEFVSLDAPLAEYFERLSTLAAPNDEHV